MLFHERCGREQWIQFRGFWKRMPGPSRSLPIGRRVEKGERQRKRRGYQNHDGRRDERRPFRSAYFPLWLKEGKGKKKSKGGRRCGARVCEANDIPRQARSLFLFLLSTFVCFFPKKVYSCDVLFLFCRRRVEGREGAQWRSGFPMDNAQRLDLSCLSIPITQYRH